MNAVIRAAAELQALCDAQHWRACFIGGLAVLRWGEPRETVDVDLTLLTGFGGEQPFIDTLLAHFEARIEDAAAFARTHRVLLLRADSGVGMIFPRFRGHPNRRENASGVSMEKKRKKRRFFTAEFKAEAVRLA